MYERRHEKLVTRPVFFRRVARSSAVAAAVVSLALLIGVAGYRYLENLPWIDSLLNASMILGGMGPVAELKSAAGKLFASFYALFSGLVFLTVAGLVFAPIVHRFLHKFHLDDESRHRARSPGKKG